MKSIRPFPHLLSARVLLPLMIGGLALSLSGCGRADDGDPPAKSPPKKEAKKAVDSKGGLSIKGDGIAIEATTATAMLRGYSPQPLSVRIMSGWVNEDKAKRASQEADEAERKKQAMGSFGLVTVQIAADKAEPGTYTLVPEEAKRAKGAAAETGTVIINKAKDAGLTADFTSQTGTLTIKSVSKKDNGAVAGVEGTFDGKFSSEAGESRTFSGSFRYTPKD